MRRAQTVSPRGKVDGRLWVPNHSVGPGALVPGLNWGRETLSRFWTKQNCPHPSARLLAGRLRGGRGGRQAPPPALAVSLPLREPPQPIFPLLSPLPPSRHQPSRKPLPPPTSHFPLSTLIIKPSPPPPPASGAPQLLHQRISLRSLQRDDHTRPLWRMPFPSHPPTGIFFHDHITDEQLDDRESGRHTLKPTGARERARSQAISTIVL